MSTFRYRLLQSTWGIAIDLNADATVLPSPPAATTRVSKRVYLAVSLTKPDDGHLFPLNSEERDWLARGLASIAPEIESACPDGYTLVTVRRATFSECDYQPEGLAAALVGWAAAEFGLVSTPPAGWYDPGSNRYVYSWQ